MQVSSSVFKQLASTVVCELLLGLGSIFDTKYHLRRFCCRYRTSTTKSELEIRPISISIPIPIPTQIFFVKTYAPL